MSIDTESRPRFDQLSEKVSRYDNVTSGMLTGVIFLIMTVLGFGAMWLTNIDQLKVQTKPSQVELAEAPDEGEPEGKSGVNPDLGDVPEEMPNKEQEAPNDTAPPDITQDLLQVIQQTDFADPTQNQHASGGEQGGAGGLGNKGNGLGRGGVRRDQRWRMEFGNDTRAAYKKKLDYLGIFIGVNRPGTGLQAATGFSTGNVQKTTTPPDLYFLHNDASRRDVDREILQAAGLNPGGGIVAQFYPKTLEAQLLKVELEAAKPRTEKDIKKTVFAIRNVGAGFEIYVLDQQYL